ncbi:MAG: hypothetical protein OXD50_14715 [Chloroflexi bacterium]|nr:hypothetical protein [Chloroflexota bacterium]
MGRPRAPSGGRGLGIMLILLIAALLVAVVIVLFFEPGLIDTSFNTDDDSQSLTPGETAGAPAPVLFESRLMEQAPPIPDVLGAASPIYEIKAPDGRIGPFEFQLSLTNPTQDDRNLGVYTWNGEDWIRLGDAVLTSDRSAARIALSEVPENLAILRRLQFRDVIAGRVPRGEEPQSILSGSLTIVHPDGWQPGGDGSLLGLVDLPAAATTQSVWPTVSATDDQTELVNDILASDNLRRQHIANIQHAIKSGLHDGVDIHYLNVSPALRSQFTSFISELADRLHREDRGLAVHIPISASGGIGEGAYDLSQLGASADFIVIEPPLDPTIFQASIDASLPTLLQRVQSNKLLLALRSNAVVRTSAGFSQTSQRDALGIASELSIREPGPYRPGQRVTLQGNSIMLDSLSGGLRWDNVNRVMSFTYPDQTGAAVTIWLHNRFSAAFHLQVVSQYELGGVYVSNASADPANANLWPAIAAFFEAGIPDLRLPNAILFDPIFSVEAGELSGNSGSGWQFWDLPTTPGDYRAQLVVSDGDVRVGHVITVPVRAEDGEE